VAPTTAQGGGQAQESDGSDPALVPADQAGSDGQNRAATTPANSSESSSDDQRSVNAPLPLPVPITVPPLLPGKPGGLLG